LKIFSNHKEYSKNLEKTEKHYQKNEYDSAFYYANSAKNQATSSEQKIYALLKVAELQKKIGDFSGLEETATQAYQLAENNTYLPHINNFLGIAYLGQKNYNEALNYYTESLSNSQKALDNCIIKNNLAVIYLEKKQYQTAADLLQKTITNDSLMADKEQYAKSLDNLGYALLKLNQPKAIDYLNQSLQLRTSLNNPYELVASYVHLAEYNQEKDQQLAFEWANKAFQSAKKANSPNDKLEAIKFMIINSEPTMAKELAIQQMQLSDSINNAKQTAKNQFAKIKFDSKKAAQELQKQKRLKEYFLLGIILLFGLGFLIYYRIKISNQKKIKETAYKTEARIAKKLHDELANDVHNAIAFAETQNLENPSNKETLLENLDTIYSRTRNISKENKDINTGEKYLEKLKAIMASYNSNNRNIIVNTDLFNAPKTSKEIKITIYRVIQELLVNMKKHSQCSIASISIKSNNKTVEINYSDNGIGVANLLNLKNGLQNAENRIHSLKGTITFDTEPNKGFKAKITIPN